MHDLQPSFPNWQAFLNSDKKSLHQGILIENIEHLLQAFPDQCSQQLNRVSKIDGLCKGLAIAFEEAYLTNSLNKHINLYMEIANWNKNPASLDQKTLDRWFKFIEKILLYQSGSNIVQADPILAIGSTHFYRPVQDKKCLLGSFDALTLERVLNNPIVEETLQCGMILIYFPTYDDYHAISIRKMQEYWYLYDSNHNDLVKYFLTTEALSSHLSAEVSFTLILIFISFDQMLKPNQEIISIANSVERLYGEAFHNLFMIQEHNPILSYDQIFKEENFEHIAPAAFFGQMGKYECTPLHFAFSKKSGHYFIPLFKYAWPNLAAALQVQDKNGYTPFMMMFMHNPEVADAVLEILFSCRYPPDLLACLSTPNHQKENALYLAAFFKPDLIVQLFDRLPEYRLELIELMMCPNCLGVTALWAFCRKAASEDIRKLETYMPEYFCALPDC